MNIARIVKRCVLHTVHPIRHESLLDSNGVKLTHTHTIVMCPTILPHLVSKPNHRALYSYRSPDPTTILRRGEEFTEENSGIILDHVLSLDELLLADPTYTSLQPCCQKSENEGWAIIPGINARSIDEILDDALKIRRKLSR
tara:strand:- start:157 stop:582 length:426 start_codon:yes stop_codon:yes gene_type:complete